MSPHNPFPVSNEYAETIWIKPTQTYRYWDNRLFHTDKNNMMLKLSRLMDEDVGYIGVGDHVQINFVDATIKFIIKRMLPYIPCSNCGSEKEQMDMRLGKYKTEFRMWTER